MRIEPHLGSAALAGVQPTRRTGRAVARFELGSGGAPSRGSAARGAVSFATLDAIIALQGEEDPAERKRRWARKGKVMLDALDELKASLLMGRIPRGALAHLSATLSVATGSGDPGLDAVLAEIDLRVRVEIAKLKRLP